MSERPTLLKRLGRLFEILRHLVANLVLLVLIVVVVAAAVQAYRSRIEVPDGAALVLNPRGVLVEQLSGSPRSRLSTYLAGVPAAPRQTLLRDVLDSLRLATFRD